MSLSRGAVVTSLPPPVNEIGQFPGGKHGRCSARCLIRPMIARMIPQAGAQRDSPPFALEKNSEKPAPGEHPERFFSIVAKNPWCHNCSRREPGSCCQENA